MLGVANSPTYSPPAAAGCEVSRSTASRRSGKSGRREKGRDPSKRLAIVTPEEAGDIRVAALFVGARVASDPYASKALSVA
jgi:hypothetical protein